VYAEVDEKKETCYAKLDIENPKTINVKAISASPIITQGLSRLVFVDQHIYYLFFINVIRVGAVMQLCSYVIKYYNASDGGICTVG
jgi:hypothetical protein